MPRKNFFFNLKNLERQGFGFRVHSGELSNKILVTQDKNVTQLMQKQIQSGLWFHSTIQPYNIPVFIDEQHVLFSGTHVHFYVSGFTLSNNLVKLLLPELLTVGLAVHCLHAVLVSVVGVMLPN